MSRLLVVERDTARRDSLHFVLSQAGFDVSFMGAHEAAAQAQQTDLVIIGDADLSLLEKLPRHESRLSVPVFALVNPGNSSGILKCLKVGVAGVFSRHRTSEEIVAKIRAILNSSTRVPQDGRE